MVPHEVSMNIMADTELEALEEAQRRFKASPRDHVMPCSGDESSAFDWVPHAECIE